ncbi:type II secretion system F family protein [Sporocytophaga myxococcoides]|uniref:type II secretion system F family protein n=1 Tax=Sporocytophaga myxococcoides TaxID=153721 RepID=UPI0003FC0037|nr:type II secretion system F family protein [Sporocytophaga myxococcoides]
MNGIDLTKVKKTKSKDPGNAPVQGILDFLNRDLSLFGNKLNDKKKEAFYHEIGILLSAGVDIKTTLELISDEQTREKDKALFSKIKDSVIAGNTLSGAIRDTGMFSAYEFFSLQIGEESGKLPIVLKELGAYYNKKMKQRRQIVGALTYPSIVLFTSLAAVFFMMNIIVPMFADVFKRFGGDLPAITKMIVNTSAFFRKYFYLFFLFIISIILFIYSQRQQIWFRKYGSKILLRIPLAGEIVRKVYLARFCNSMTLLIGAKIPILRSINLVKQMIGFYPLEESLTQIEKDILHGMSLNKSMSAFSIYPKRMTSLIKVGEEVNQLDNFFEKIAFQYNEEVEHQTSMISSMIEPFMIIFLGLIVGFILIAMYLPLFQLSTSF